MFDMAPMRTGHSAITSRLHELFVLAASRSATVVGGGPVVLGEFSEPQPDLMLLKRRDDFYSGAHPVAGRRIHTYREPAAKGYACSLGFTAADSLAPQAFPDVRIAVGELFG